MPNLEETVAAAGDPNAAPSLLRELAFPEQDLEVLLRLVLNTNTPAEALNIIMREVPDLRTRQLCSKHPNLSTLDLEENAMDSDERIRINTAAHSGTDPRSLSTLSRDDSMMVRYETLYNPNTPAEDRARLSQDDHIFVRLAAKNQKGG